MSDPFEDQIKQQLGLIQQYLEGTTAQINSMTQKIDLMSKTFAESMTNLSENMRLIIEVIKKGRSNLGETVDELADHINSEIKKLYEENNCREEWSSLVENIRRDHYRKYSFIGDFEKIVSGESPEYLESFEERTRKRWEKQISD